MKDERCMRWSPGGHQSWRRRRDGGFDRALYRVAEIGTLQAKPFVEEMHYSRSFPADRRNYGMFEIASGRLVGVAVLSTPTSEKTIPAVFPELDPKEAAELGRFVLLDEVPANAESWFLGKVREKAAGPSDLAPDKPSLHGLVMFSDPVQRRRADGTLICPGHWGTIYQASGCLYLGMSGASTEALLPDGTVFGRRTAQKIRAQEKGHGYAERKLIALGARPMRPGEKPAAWLTRVRQISRDIESLLLGRPGKMRESLERGVSLGSGVIAGQSPDSRCRHSSRLALAHDHIDVRAAVSVDLCAGKGGCIWSIGIVRTVS